MWVSGSTWAGLLVRVRGCGYFFVFFFKFEFYYWDLSFSLKSDIDVTVQSHLKMFELCATTRVMCLRYPTPIVHVWDVARRSRFSACDSCSELPCVVLCRSTVIFSDKQNWWKAPRLVTPTRQKHQTDSLPLPFRPRPRYRRRQGPSRSSRPPRSACQPPAFSWVLVPSSPRYRARHASVPGRSGCRASPRSGMPYKKEPPSQAPPRVRLEIKAFETDVHIERPSHVRHLPPKKASYSTSIGGNIGSPWHLHFDERSPRHLFFHERRLTW